MRKKNSKTKAGPGFVAKYPRQWFAGNDALQMNYDTGVVNAFNASSPQGQGGAQAATLLEQDFFVICDSLSAIATLYNITGPTYDTSSKLSQLITAVNLTNDSLRNVSQDIPHAKLPNYYNAMLTIQNRLNDCQNQATAFLNYVTASYDIVTSLIQYYLQAGGPKS
jgi:hypothetical protein